MISRLTACAVFFAVFATAGLAYAADVQRHAPQPGPAPLAALQAGAPPVLELPGVVVTRHRNAR